MLDLKDEKIKSFSQEISLMGNELVNFSKEIFDNIEI